MLFGATKINYMKFLKVGAKTMADSYIEQNKNFVTFTDKLFAAKTEHVLYGQKTKYPLSYIVNLETEINKEPLVSDRLWLLEKVQELKNRLNK